MYVINPELPEPYKYETDYRKIPKGLLDNNIPKGRDKVKWSPFKTVSDQYKLLDEYIEEQKKLICLCCLTINYRYLMKQFTTTV